MPFPQYDAEVFEEIHGLPTFMSQLENEDSRQFIFEVLVVITILQLILLGIVRFIGGVKEEKAAWKASYQITNLLVNLSLGLSGIYVHVFRLHHSAPVLYKIIGYPNYKTFALGQIGYQLWALPMGALFVDESPAMLVHHVAVICVASTSAFLKCGFRYYTPYFYGLIEISSVPLSVMNSFKNNKKWIEKFPRMYSAVRLMFAVSFLLVRVILWTPFYLDYLITVCMLVFSGGSTVARIILSMFIVASLLLTVMQYWWASRILKSIFPARQGAIKGPPKQEDKEVRKKGMKKVKKQEAKKGE